MYVPVLTAAQSAACDRLEIDAGTPSLELMRRAGERAARAVTERLPSECAHGVSIFVGSGNNGGDGWIVARELLGRGVRVAVHVIAPPATPDARAAASLVNVDDLSDIESPGVVIDALLGTGARGAPRDAIAAAILVIHRHKMQGATVVSLDIPSGMDATTGQCPAAVVHADLTLCFGSWKRGLLARRDFVGELVLIDIGVRAHLDEPVPLSIDSREVRRTVPSIGALDHKGKRRKLLIVGASSGMAGASVLAARAAQRSGIGMLRFCAHPDSATALQAGCPEAVTTTWPPGEPGDAELAWPDGLLIGPGFGVDAGARARVDAWLQHWRGPVVVDADVFTAFAGDAASLGSHLRGRPAVATPHVAECARVLGVSVDGVIADPNAAAARLATVQQACVLHPPVPTIVAEAEGRIGVVARGTPALGTAGSGDVLGGIVATLLAQRLEPFDAATCGAWIHGRAAEIAGTGRPLRGVTLADVITMIPESWRLGPEQLGEHERAVLPRVGEG
jgi:NAD(P)H-hydrate epimerase